MATFTVTGHKGPHIAHMTWTDGVLSGDAADVRYLTEYAQALEGEFVSGMLGAGSTTEHLKNPWTAYNLMHLVFSDTPLVTAGALPEIAAPPKGSVL
jgi:hypothetical protein